MSADRKVRVSITGEFAGGVFEGVRATVHFRLDRAAARAIIDQLTAALKTRADYPSGEAEDRHIDRTTRETP